MAPDEVGDLEPLPLRPDLTDCHYSQLFFVVGHIAIKMLSYVDFLESDLKNALTESYKKKQERSSTNQDGDEKS